MAQAGFPGFEVVGWFAYFVHAKTPRPIAEKLHAELSQIIRSPEISDFLKERGTLPTGIGLEEFGRKNPASVPVKTIKAGGFFRRAISTARVGDGSKVNWVFSEPGGELSDRRSASIPRHRAEFLFDAQQLVVLRGAVAAAG